MRRALLALASVSALLLAACGSSTIESQFVPARAVVFGDAFSDYGQRGSRYTVNDGSINLWTYDVIASFGLSIAPSASGGLSYAAGSARVNTKPDAAGDNTTLTVKEQVDAFLAGNAPTPTDLVIVSGGIADIIADTAKVNAGTMTRDQMIADIKLAARDLGAQVRRLITAGATHVVVVGPYDLSRTPWGASQADLLTEASTRFNTDLLVSIADLGNNALYVDAALLYNLVTGSPQSYGFTNSADPVCTSVDPGPGIGIGAGQINSALCTTSTIVTGADINTYVFADRVYPTAQGQRKFGDYAFDRIKARW
jgi:phospholipase/lecithinase/hemolysin